ncbi:hypothetical protein BGW39_009993, partial [Mortierella sp. 14UC]
MTHLTNTLIDATSTVVALPELLEVIGQHLNQPDIASCLQVCHAWNKILTPLLWREVDDLAWEEFLKQDTVNAAKEWVQIRFSNHGQHIRHLCVQTNTVLNIATEECRHLVSLTANRLAIPDQ